MKLIIPEHIKTLMRRLLDSGKQAYIIGGAIRDSLISIEPHDWDIFTDATGGELLKIFPEGKVLGGEERQAKILTVIVEGTEISSFRSNGDRTETCTSLEQHQSTCDFTINCIACDINGDIVTNDYSRAGRMDIRHRILRFVGNEEDRINEDKLRILRGIRFVIKYGLVNQTKILTKLHLLDDLPKERISTELKKIMSIEQPWNMFTTYMYTLFSHFIKEMKLNDDLAGGSHHNETVDFHLMNALARSSKITDNPLVRMSAFLHDVAKGMTISKEIKDVVIKSVGVPAPIETKDDYVEVTVNFECPGPESIDTHFYQHEKVGAELVSKFMREYKFSEADTEFVFFMIKNHMFSYKDEQSKKSYIKFFNKMEAAGVDIMDYVMLLYCDNQANWAKPRVKFGDFVKHCHILNYYWELKHTKEAFKVSDMVVSGKDLIQRYNMQQGPMIGRMLNEVFETILNGDCTNDRAEIFKVLDAIADYENEVH